MLVYGTNSLHATCAQRSGDAGATFLAPETHIVPPRSVFLVPMHYRCVAHAVDNPLENMPANESSGTNAATLLNGVLLGYKARPELAKPAAWHSQRPQAPMLSTPTILPLIDCALQACVQAYHATGELRLLELHQVLYRPGQQHPAHADNYDVFYDVRSVRGLDTAAGPTATEASADPDAPSFVTSRASCPSRAPGPSPTRLRVRGSLALSPRTRCVPTTTG